MRRVGLLKQEIKTKNKENTEAQHTASSAGMPSRLNTTRYMTVRLLANYTMSSFHCSALSNC